MICSISYVTEFKSEFDGFDERPNLLADWEYGKTWLNQNSIIKTCVAECQFKILKPFWFFWALIDRVFSFELIGLAVWYRKSPFNEKNLTCGILILQRNISKSLKISWPTVSAAA